MNATTVYLQSLPTSTSRILNGVTIPNPASVFPSHTLVDAANSHWIMILQPRVELWTEW